MVAAHEALELRAAGLDGPLLVMGALTPDELPIALQARADVVAWTPEFLERRRLPRRAGPTRVHVKLDTRDGSPGDARPGARRRPRDSGLSSNPRRRVGLMTHFATADEPGDTFMADQLARFLAWAEPLKAATPHWSRHAANSAATLRDPTTHLDLVRCGVAVYGMDPFGATRTQWSLRPALTLASYVAVVKPCATGESAGYGRRFVADRDTMIATVPIGYGDGWRRGLTNATDVLIGGRRFPHVGTVSMDNVTVDLGPDGGGVRVGDTVTLLGRDGGDRILAEDLAAAMGTINYEVTCGLLPRVPRVEAGAGDVSEALDAARAALRDEKVWLVGGAVRDRLLGRAIDDIDLVVDGDVKAAARHLALAVGGPVFALSDAHGAWRVIGPGRAWQIDLAPMRGSTITDDLELRDFTVNAIAEPLAGGRLIDPHDGADDIRRHRLRMVTGSSFPDDPLRVLRLARFACELGLEPEPPTVTAAREHVAGIERVAAERVFAELRRIVGGSRAVHGFELMADLGLTARILPELEALRGWNRTRTTTVTCTITRWPCSRRCARCRRIPPRCWVSSTVPQWRRSSPRRFPTTSPAAPRCASAPCCTTSPSR